MINVLYGEKNVFVETKCISVDLALNIFLAENSGGMGGCFM